MKKLISFLCCGALMVPFSAAAADETPDAEFPAGDVPRVYISTEDGNGTALVKNMGYISADIAVVDTSGKLVHETGIIKVRGNSTALAAKKPYTFKLDTKQNLLGMGKGKKWILLASCLDPTFLRNETALKLSRDMEIPYTSEHRYVELWLDGEYRGCYELVEPVAEGKNRVDIDIESNNGMADFLVQHEYSRAHAGSVYIKPEGLRFEIKDPEITSDDQRAYINEKLGNVIKVIKSLNYDEIKKVIDVDSFAKFYLVNEFYKDVDFGFSSAFFYYKNGILYAGPPWDYDLTAGNVNSGESNNAREAVEPTGLFANRFMMYEYLWKCRDFRNDVRRIYGENHEYFEDVYRSGGEMDRVISEYGHVFERNFTDAPWKVGSQYWYQTRKPEATYEANVEFMRDFLKTRDEWMYEYFDPEGPVWYDVGDVDGNSSIGISDAVRLMKYLLGAAEFSEAQWLASDLNSDSAVDSYDMVLMRNLIINK